MNVGQIIAEAKQAFKCEKCGKEFEFSFWEDAYIVLGAKDSVRVRCPHCQAEYAICIDLELKDNTKQEW